MYTLPKDPVMLLSFVNMKLRDEFSSLDELAAACSATVQEIKDALGKINYEYNPKQKFIDNQIEQAERQFKQIGLKFEVIEKIPKDIIKNSNPALLIIDFNPILKRDYLKNADFKIYEIDGHNIIPARFVSDKQELNTLSKSQENLLKNYSNPVFNKKDRNKLLKSYTDLQDIGKSLYRYNTLQENNCLEDVQEEKGNIETKVLKGGISYNKYVWHSENGEKTSKILWNKARK